jgi:hypothetical protein
VPGTGHNQYVLRPTVQSITVKADILPRRYHASLLASAESGMLESNCFFAQMDIAVVVVGLMR